MARFLIAAAFTFLGLITPVAPLQAGLPAPPALSHPQQPRHEIFAVSYGGKVAFNRLTLVKILNQYFTVAEDVKDEKNSVPYAIVKNEDGNILIVY